MVVLLYLLAFSCQYVLIALFEVLGGTLPHFLHLLLNLVHCARDVQNPYPARNTVNHVG